MGKVTTHSSNDNLTIQALIEMMHSKIAMAEFNQNGIQCTLGINKNRAREVKRIGLYNNDFFYTRDYKMMSMVNAVTKSKTKKSKVHLIVDSEGCITGLRNPNFRLSGKRVVEPSDDSTTKAPTALSADIVWLDELETPVKHVVEEVFSTDNEVAKNVPFEGEQKRRFDDGVAAGHILAKVVVALSLITIAFAIFTPKAEATEFEFFGEKWKPFIEIGVGYKFDEKTTRYGSYWDTTDFTFKGVKDNGEAFEMVNPMLFDGKVFNDPISAELTLGITNDIWTLSIHHSSQYFSNKPFNDEQEYSKTELLLSYRIWL